ncbi:unnamed protein product [Discosporangium mesarthrocarpum]
MEGPTELWRWQNGTTENDYFQVMTTGADGSTYLGGYTYGNWSGVNAGLSDFAVVKLDANGTAVWCWQEGTTEYDRLTAMTADSDGSIYLGGYTFGNWSGANAGLSDFAVVKLDANGTAVWRWQEGTSTNDYFYAMTTGVNGSIYLGGFTSGNWGGVNAGLVDFAAVKLDKDGTAVWRWQGGTSDLDIFRAVTTGTDGSIYLGGYTKGDWSGVNSGLSDFAAVKLDADGMAVWRWQAHMGPSSSGATPVETGVG